MKPRLVRGDAGSERRRHDVQADLLVLAAREFGPEPGVHQDAVVRLPDECVIATNRRAVSLQPQHTVGRAVVNVRPLADGAGDGGPAGSRNHLAGLRVVAENPVFEPIPDDVHQRVIHEIERVRQARPVHRRVAAGTQNFPCRAAKVEPRATINLRYRPPVHIAVMRHIRSAEIGGHGDRRFRAGRRIGGKNSGNRLCNSRAAPRNGAVKPVATHEREAGGTKAAAGETRIIDAVGINVAKLAHPETSHDCHAVAVISINRVSNILAGNIDHIVGVQRGIVGGDGSRSIVGVNEGDQTVFICGVRIEAGRQPHRVSSVGQVIIGIRNISGVKARVERGQIGAGTENYASRPDSRSKAKWIARAQLGQRAKRE